MKVFISHTFTTEDKRLASALQKVLRYRGIIGYLAEKKKRYDLLTRDKIRKEIEKSDYLVAIITNKARESASVNQEIGFALGMNVPVVVLLEKKAKLGVLVHGIEPEEFKRDNFEKSCLNIRKHVLTKGPRKKKSTAKEKNTENVYQKYDPPKRLQRLRTDTIKAFKEYGFKHRKKILKKEKDDYSFQPDTKTVDIVENHKTKQRFFLDFYRDKLIDINLRQLRDDISDYYFRNLVVSKEWKNICFDIALGNVTKHIVESTYSFDSRHNTTIQLSPSIIYNGVAEKGQISTRQMKSWRFEYSMPKFFVSKIKSKEDIVDRIGIIEEFIGDHKKIFKIASKLKSFEKQYRPKPKKVKQKRRRIWTGRRRIPAYRA